MKALYITGLILGLLTLVLNAYLKDFNGILLGSLITSLNIIALIYMRYEE